MRALLDRGAKTDMKTDESGLTPYDMAQLFRQNLTRYRYPALSEDKVSNEDLELLLEPMKP